MAYKDERITSRTPGIESRLELVARGVLVLTALGVLRVLWLYEYAGLWGTLEGLTVVIVSGAFFYYLLHLLAEHVRLRRHELGFEYDGSLVREPVTDLVCSECGHVLHGHERGCSVCGERFDEVDPQVGGAVSAE